MAIGFLGPFGGARRAFPRYKIVVFGSSDGETWRIWTANRDIYHDLGHFGIDLGYFGVLLVILNKLWGMLGVI